MDHNIIGLMVSVRRRDFFFLPSNDIFNNFLGIIYFVVIVIGLRNNIKIVQP